MFLRSCKHRALAGSQLKKRLTGREGPRHQTACARQGPLGCNGKSHTQVRRALSEKHRGLPEGFASDGNCRRNSELKLGGHR